MYNATTKFENLTTEELAALVDELRDGPNTPWAEAQIALDARVHNCKAKWALVGNDIVESDDLLDGVREYELTCTIPASAIPLNKIKRIETNVMKFLGTDYFSRYEASALAYIGLTPEQAAEYVVIGSCYQDITAWCPEGQKVEFGAHEFEIIIRKQDLAEATNNWINEQNKPLTQNPFQALSALCA